LINKILNESKTLDQLYDEETNYGTDLRKQEGWSRRIVKELKELNDYRFSPAGRNIP
jgi:hypothetical protein